MATSVIRVQNISHVRFAAPELSDMRRFLEDFGLVCFEDGGRLYARGSDGAPFAHVTEPGAPAFRGLGLRAASLDDLHRLAASEGVAVEAFDAPGGGFVVRLLDPDGNGVEVVAGQAWGDASPCGSEAQFNSASERRRLRRPVRLSPGPSRVRRLGHTVLNVGDFRASESWYKQRFGFITSDEIEAAPDVAMGAFMRCDRGDQPTDHHTLFLAQLPSGKGFNHAAFEVEGLDDLMLGHSHLKAKGRTSAWGVGRHKLGSQIFDYWKDPWGHELEHWTDGDVFTAADGSKKATVRDLLDVQWGAPFPALAGKHAPSIETAGKLMALNIRLRRLFRRKPKEIAV
jgi:catechol 2,3-dioxygenase-like lactoylglutathione lyase family enzyme